MVYIRSLSTDPYFNLALEQYVFDCLPKTKAYFMLWQNDNTIVVGKHQNTSGEINAAFVKERGINVVRRLSGGGAVYHDLGNVNFTFIMDAGKQRELDLSSFCIPVVQALRTLGINAELNGRNDIIIDGKKFSGNSQYMKDGRIMHHGTIMYSSDLDTVEKALCVSPDKIVSKGVSSVRSRVTNIVDHMENKLRVEEFILRIQDSILGEDYEKYELSHEDIEAVNRLRNEKYVTWEWNYGKSPRCTVRRERRIEGVGKIVLDMEIENGVLTAFDSFGDFFGNGADAVSKALCGTRMSEDALLSALSAVDIDSCWHKLTAKQLVDLMLL
ncbi:MAG: lipoate--protein ligase [Oscillospiraceae bacterium]